MADNKNGRDKQAQDQERRQRERDLKTELERKDEPEPSVETEELAALETELDALEYPVTGADLVTAVGNYELGTATETYDLADLIPETEAETYDAPGAVRAQVERPTVAATMKRILEATAKTPHAELARSQRKAYERTFLALRAIDADDDDEGLQVIGDWVIEQLREKEKLPGSRAVRREAAKFCRSNGYEVRVDTWLGI